LPQLPRRPHCLPRLRQGGQVVNPGHLRRRLLDPETTKNPNAFKPSVQAVVKALSALDPEFGKTPKQRGEREKQYLVSFPFDLAIDITGMSAGASLFMQSRIVR
jgi:hypothetical protein